MTPFSLNFSRLAAIAASGCPLQTFSAAVPERASEAEVKECADFLAELVKLGASPETLPVMEQAFWLLLRGGAPLTWDNVPAFLPGFRQVDRAQIEAALREVMPEDLSVIAETEAWAEALEKQQWEGQDLRDAVRAQGSVGPSIGAMVRGAAFIKIALKAGVASGWDALPKLRQLVWTEASLGIEDAGAAGMRQALGVSKSDWAKKDIKTYAAPAGSVAAVAAAAAADETAELMRRRLGISKATWDRYAS